MLLSHELVNKKVADGIAFIGVDCPRTLWPEQQLYEKIRPVVLFQESAAERAKEIGDSPRTL